MADTKTIGPLPPKPDPAQAKADEAAAVRRAGDVSRKGGK